MKLFKGHKKIWAGIGIGVLVVLLIVFYFNWLSRTKIAFVNYQPVTLQTISQANNNPMIKLYEVSVDDLDDLDDYDVVLITGMGLQITAEQRNLIQKAADGGTPIYTSMATNPDNNISNFTLEESALITKYMMSLSKKNCRSMLNFLRRNVDGKIIFTGNIEKPQQKPDDYLFYPAENASDEDENEFFSVKDYEQFMKSKGIWFDGHAKIVVTGVISDPTDLIKALVKKQYNVYPISSFLRLRQFVEEIEPNAIINMAHGRLGDEMVEYLKENNVLLFDPLNVNMPVEDWEADPMGMLGGFMSQSVVMPEIDGAIRTTVVFGLKKEKDGLLHPYAIPERLNTFVKTVENHLNLQNKTNAEKRLAIVYYKGPGQSNLTASGMDVAKSLYNTLTHLRAEGYNVNGLPASLAEFKQQIQKEGSLFNAFAEGDVERYLKNGHPVLISQQEYDSWTSTSLRSNKRQEMDEVFGAFPGTHNKLQTEGKLAFPCIQYGNIALLPQPMAGEGKDEFKITHGTGQVPPHSYVAPYLWIQYGFKADALLHFGTHGSLEFTPQKQVALSNDDWADRLVGTLPHFYYYTIDNVGEGMIAKRRSYATLLSYLTPPFHESQLRNTFKNLEEKIFNYENNKGNKDGLAAEIKHLAEQLGINKDLGIDSKTYSEAEIERISNYVEELADEKITDTPYIMGIPYAQNDIRTTVFAMTVDPIAYSLYALDKTRGKADADLLQKKHLFNAIYLKRAHELVQSLYNNPTPVSNQQLARIAGITEANIATADSILAVLQAPKGMMAMLMASSSKKDDKKNEGKNGGGSMADMMNSMKNADTEIPEAKRGPIAKLMQWNMRKMMAKKDPSSMLELARKMGASEEALKKMEASLNKQMGISKDTKEKGKKQTSMQSASPTLTSTEIETAHAINEVRTALNNVANYRTLLQSSPTLELEALTNGLAGKYIAPSAGGDPIVNPNTLPTGRNLFAINAEETPTADAWEKGVMLAKNTLEEYKKNHNGEYPRKVSYTLWSGEFVQTGGATVAQVLYMLGVEPVRDRYGRVNDLALIPSETLGRPRIDVVVQTSGQLRDLAASRLFLINRAVRMAAAANDEAFANQVKAGVEESEQVLIDKGISPKQAREMSAYRVFGGAGGGYGTGIQGMVEQGNAWDDEKQIADVYTANMGAFYGDQENWMSDMQDAFSAALTRTDVVVQPRQNNTWGALTLDHVYEFMGGMNLAVRNITGKDPDAVFSDYRNRNNYRIQTSKEAIGVEARTKLFNPTYIKNALEGGELHTDEIAAMVRNTYGWNVMKPANIDNEMWDNIYDVYVKDKYKLDVTSSFGNTNPTAMMEMTATMMETARKGYWKATPEQLADIANLHTEFVKKYGPTGSSFEGANPKLQAYIAQNASPEQAAAYKKQYKTMTERTDKTSSKGMVMEKQKLNNDENASRSTISTVLVVGIVFVAFVVLIIFIRQRRKKQH